MKVVTSAILLTLLFGCSEESPKQSDVSERQPLSVVTGIQPGTGLLRIADSEKYFQQHNLSVTITEKTQRQTGYSLCHRQTSRCRCHFHS